MEILLHKVCGRPASRTMTLRAARPEDAAAFYALQNEVRAAMPHPEQFVPDTLENIARYLKEDLCIGGWDGERLGAALALLRPGIVGIGATVSPENQYSLNNALASGFEIVCRREMYGGYDRYLLAKRL